MSFVTGLLLVDAPASALNNLGNIPGERYDNSVGVKIIQTKEGAFPYVSAQAFRYWLRATLASNPAWKAAPIYREEKVAYVDSNPIEWWDDDLLGYMRAPSKKKAAVEKRATDESRADETPTTDTVTRVSPFRVSTLVSIAPVSITSDFGVMARHEGDPVPYEHQFYRATLQGLISLDLRSAGTFSYKNKSGYRNLDNVRIEIAKKQGLEHLEKEKSYRLSRNERLDRVKVLLDGLSRLEGGAKLTLHYTDVNPPFVVLAVTKGGNHIFGRIVGANRGSPVIKTDALAEALDIFGDQILSQVYIGWAQGYQDEERARFDAWREAYPSIIVDHPRVMYRMVIEELEKHPDWMD
jgi:CRISPR-associated protein Cst2